MGACVDRAGHELGGLRASPGLATCHCRAGGKCLSLCASQRHLECSLRVLPALTLDTAKTLAVYEVGEL